MKKAPITANKQRPAQSNTTHMLIIESKTTLYNHEEKTQPCRCPKCLDAFNSQSRERSDKVGGCLDDWKAVVFFLYEGNLNH